MQLQLQSHLVEAAVLSCSVQQDVMPAVLQQVRTVVQCHSAGMEAPVHAASLRDVLKDAFAGMRKDKSPTPPRCASALL